MFVRFLTLIALTAAFQVCVAHARSWLSSPKHEVPRTPVEEEMVVKEGIEPSTPAL